MRFWLLILFTCTALFAHKLHIFAYSEGGEIFIQGYFSKSAPCKGCNISFLDKDKKLIKKSVTDSSGKARVAVGIKKVAYIALDDAMGHKSVVEFLDAKASESKSSPLMMLFGLVLFVLVFLLLYLLKRKK